MAKFGPKDIKKLREMTDAGMIGIVQEASKGYLMADMGKRLFEVA